MSRGKRPSHTLKTLLRRLFPQRPPTISTTDTNIGHCSNEQYIETAIAQSGMLTSKQAFSLLRAVAGERKVTPGIEKLLPLTFALFDNIFRSSPRHDYRMRLGACAILHKMGFIWKTDETMVNLIQERVMEVCEDAFATGQSSLLDGASIAFACDAVSQSRLRCVDLAVKVSAEISNTDDGGARFDPPALTKIVIFLSLYKGSIHPSLWRLTLKAIAWRTQSAIESFSGREISTIFRFLNDSNYVCNSLMEIGAKRIGSIASELSPTDCINVARYLILQSPITLSTRETLRVLSSQVATMTALQTSRPMRQMDAKEFLHSVECAGIDPNRLLISALATSVARASLLALRRPLHSRINP